MSLPTNLKWYLTAITAADSNKNTILDLNQLKPCMMSRQKLKLREDLGQGEFDLKKTNSTSMREENTNRALPFRK